MNDTLIDTNPKCAILPVEFLVWTATALVALPWFWPIIAGPLPAMLPDLSAWLSGALLVGLWPRVRYRFDEVVAWGLLFAAVGSAFLGLLQYFDVENNIGVWVVLTKPGEVTANIQQTNLLATLLAVGLLCILYLLTKKRLSAFNASWTAFVLVVSLAATASRTGMVHLILISVLVLYWWPGRKLYLFASLIGVGAIYLIATQVLPWLFQLIWGYSLERNLFSRLGEDYACVSRKVLWTNVAHLISLKPWTGWGPGELLFAHYITPYDGERFCMKLSNAHNLPLHFAFVWGIPAALCACLFAILSFLKLRPWNTKLYQEQFGWSILSLVGFHSLVEFPLWYGLFQILVALAIVMVVLGRRESNEAAHSESQLPAVHSLKFVAVSIALLLALAFVAVDYFKVSQLYLPAKWRPAWYQVDTLNKARDTVLFKSDVLIAQVVLTPVTHENALIMLDASLEALHIAPDSRIIRQVIAAAQAAGRDDLVKIHTGRYKASWPELYEEWVRLESARHDVPERTN
ncbi:MAG: hypothetical protein DCF26_15350 [Burkholderiales bacterium]|nr:MAG: hypothetical protein DCF26_15350 [Burkholderiales bacterium]